MTNFHPNRDMTLYIDQNYYEFVPYTNSLDDDGVYAMEGGEAVIYKVRNRSSNTFYALKVSKPAYRGEQIVRATAALARYIHVPGLSLGNRICLTKARSSQLLAEYPDLEYATLMPWLSGKTWSDFMFDGSASARYTPAQAYALALSAASVLWHLEAHRLAHTDIAGGNIMLSPERKQVELLDIEGLYVPGAPMPELRSQGSPGYQHRNLDQRGQWRPDGDRFAGAVLLAEMLTWVDPYVRALTPDNAESLFQPKELQAGKTKRWDAVSRALSEICPSVLPLFDQAWFSADVSQCPDFSTWTLALIQAGKP